MSLRKKEIRHQFRDTCFKRDKYKCIKCDFQSTPAKSIEELDCHHIMSRFLLNNGGYVPSNGISLCSSCHLKAEEYYSTGIVYPGYSIEDLYIAINSSIDKAIEDNDSLC